MRIQPRFTFLLPMLAALFLGAAAPASAAVVTYSNQAAFTAAVFQPVVGTFGDLAQGALPGPLARTGYQANVRDNLGLNGQDGAEDFFVLDNGAGGNWLSTNFAANTLVFSNFAPNVRAIGGSFFSTGIDGAVLAGQTLLLSLTDASGTFDFVLNGLNSSSFRGFTSDSAIVSLSLTGIQGRDFNFATAGSLILAEVPEPGNLALFMLAALCGLAVRLSVRRSR